MGETKYIRCRKCNRILKTTDAQQRGYGLICYKQILKLNHKGSVNLFNVENIEDKH